MKIPKTQGKGSGWIIDSVIDHNINILKRNLLAGSSYIKLPKILNHPKKGLINIKRFDDNQCFKWCLRRCLHPGNHHPAKIKMVDIMFESELDFKDIKFPVKIRDTKTKSKQSFYLH